MSVSVATFASAIDNINRLNTLKMKIENMSKQHNIEILRILKKYNGVKLNENRSGIFVNLTFLNVAILEEIETFVEYIIEQEHTIQSVEQQKNECRELLNVKT